MVGVRVGHHAVAGRGGQAAGVCEQQAAVAFGWLLFSGRLFLHCQAEKLVPFGVTSSLHACRRCQRRPGAVLHAPFQQRLGVRAFQLLSIYRDGFVAIRTGLESHRTQALLAGLQGGGAQEHAGCSERVGGSQGSGSWPSGNYVAATPAVVQYTPSQRWDGGSSGGSQSPAPPLPQKPSAPYTMHLVWLAGRARASAARAPWRRRLPWRRGGRRRLPPVAVTRTHSVRFRGGDGLQCAAIDEVRWLRCELKCSTQLASVPLGCSVLNGLYV